MTILMEIFGYFYWWLVGGLIGGWVLMRLVKGVVDAETWNMIDHTDALPDELIRILKRLVSLNNPEKRLNDDKN